MKEERPWRRKRIYFNCLQCGQEDYTVPSQRAKYKGAGQFCSKACHFAYYRANPQEHPIFKSRIVHSNGYILVHDPHLEERRKQFPFGRLSTDKIYEHRFVMEQHLGRLLSPHEHVHHINGNKQDNRLENLEVLSEHEHHKLHGFGREGAWGKGEDWLVGSPDKGWQEPLFAYDRKVWVSPEKRREMVRLYTIERLGRRRIANRMGLGTTVVRRVLDEEGVQLRGPGREDLGKRVPRPCEECGSPFIPPNKDSRYCSMACRNARNRETVICPGCGEPFSFPRCKKRRYCSQACYHKIKAEIGEHAYEELRQKAQGLGKRVKRPGRNVA